MSAKEQPACDDSSTVEVPPQPDLRQSFSHTLLAAAFILLGVTNPFSPRGTEAAFHSWMMVALAVVVVMSWSLLVRRWMRWRRLPASIRVRVIRSPDDLRQRAVSHLLLSLLALLLAGFAMLGRFEVLDEDGPSIGERIPLVLGGMVGVGAVAVATRCIRDLLALRRASRRP